MDKDLRAGIRDASPLLLGILSFGLVAGIAAVEADLTFIQTLGITVIVYAGASQLAALELLDGGAPLAVVIGTAVVINLRVVMYSASIAPYFSAYRRRPRAVLAYLLTDHAYALSVAEYAENEDRDRRLYYLGAGGSIWVVWVVGTVAGVGLGTGVPEAWGFGFAVPLVFLGLLIPAMSNGPKAVAGIVAGAGAVLAAGAPLNLALLIGSIAGIAAGVAAEEVWA